MNEELVRLPGCLCDSLIDRTLVKTVIRRNLALLVVSVLGGFSLTGCSPSADTDGDNAPTAASVAVLEEFFDHLEAGETSEAAALTAVDFPAEFISEDFYAASAARPTDARIVDASGDDSHTVYATVQYVLDDPEHPVTTEYEVQNTGGERTVSWAGAGTLGLIMISTPGHIVLNEEIEFAMSRDAQDVPLLPGLYQFTYVDPTGTTQLDAHGTDEFTLAHPVDESGVAAGLPERVSVNGAAVSVHTPIGSDVIDPVEAEIERLTVECGEQAMSGPSCPPAVLEYGDALVQQASAGAEAEWFQGVGGGLTVADGEVRYSLEFTVRVGDAVLPVPAVYEGTVTRGENGVVTYTRG